MSIDFTSWPWWVQLLLSDPDKFQVFVLVGLSLAGIFLVYFVVSFFRIFFGGHDGRK